MRENRQFLMWCEVKMVGKSSTSQCPLIECKMERFYCPIGFRELERAFDPVLEFQTFLVFEVFCRLMHVNSPAPSSSSPCLFPLVDCTLSHISVNAGVGVRMGDGEKQCRVESNGKAFTESATSEILFSYCWALYPMALVKASSVSTGSWR